MHALSPSALVEHMIPAALSLCICPSTLGMLQIYSSFFLVALATNIFSLPAFLSHSTSPKTIHRASSTLAELKLAEHAKCLAANADKEIPTFRPGDSIEVKMVTHLTSTETDTYRGVVLSVRKNGADTRFTLADVRREGRREGVKEVGGDKCACRCLYGKLPVLIAFLGVGTAGSCLYPVR